ncbi:glycosyltransferase [Candidatus Uhrbacteria bacterium]|nr:glycosyltransferase [Candidatus Uhrbacteria bacterium]
MRTILFLENGVYGGGSFESLFLLVKHLDKGRFRPVVVFVNRTGWFERTRSLGIPTYLINDPVYSKIRPRIFVRFLIVCKKLLPASMLTVERLLHRGTIRALRELIKEHKVDLLHLNNQSLRDLYGVIAAQDMKIPCVSYLRSARVGSVPAMVARYLNTHVAQFVANSQFTTIYWQKLGIDHSKIRISYNAIENVPITPFDVRKEWKIDPGVTYVIGCVGNLTEGKGQEFLIRAFKKFRGNEPHAVLLIVGDGPLRAPLEDMVERIGMKDAVIFAGYNTMAREIIAGLDLLVLPSKTETFGRTLLEAMIAGTPIVATRVGGIPEIVTHEHNGLLVDYGDEQGLADAIVRVLRDPPLARQFCASGRQIVEERFSVRAHSSEVHALYDGIIGSYRAKNSSKLHS